MDKKLKAVLIAVLVKMCIRDRFDTSLFQNESDCGHAE